MDTGMHLLPFFWQHGEDEETLRNYVGVIQAANCNAFCVESRPHPDFCGPKWWQDMDAIIDEASKRGMKVWILDDSHFPSGYANGALKDAPERLCRQSVICRFVSYNGGAKKIKLDRKKLSKPVKLHLTYVQKMMVKVAASGFDRKFDDDRLLAVTAYGENGEILDLTDAEYFDKPEGKWTLAATLLSRNYGPHKTYINMMNRESCQVFIDTCYEPHFQHYEKYFGNTIAGFFSDEPELGNGKLYAKHNTLGTEQDLPWSDELEEALKREWGEDYTKYLPLLWANEYDKDKTERFRVCYMECVTRLVRDDFSYPIGDWCRKHGVQYMGHSIEDNGTHTCTGSGLGHYFRGLEGQDFAGIDDIGGQVIPQGEDEPVKDLLGERNGGFYHYVLGKLGVSLAYFDEKKQGRTMCEIFGNYGWKSGVYEQKYLADHFLVRGVNYFVPHAFSPKAYPDSDCPPHFYAHGHNPQYRAFGQLCGYMNRVADRISGGRIVAKAAIYYNAESEWAGKCMSIDKPARALYDRQIDFFFLSSDYKERASEFSCVIVPEAEYAPEWLISLPNAVFVNRLPDNLAKLAAESPADKASEGLKGKTSAGKTVVALEKLADYLAEQGVTDAVLTPADDRVRVLHYKGAQELYMVVNEGTSVYRGRMEIPEGGNWNAYDPWLDCYVDCPMEGLALGPRKSLLFLREDAKPAVMSHPVPEALCHAGSEAPIPTSEEGKIRQITEFRRSLCKSIDYPKFGDAKAVTLPDDVSKEDEKFSGFISYEAEFFLGEEREVFVKVTKPAEAVEVFVNGNSAGIQIVPDYVFDVSELVQKGANALRIEVATTLGRENNNSMRARMMGGTDKNPTGIIGGVYLYTE